MVLRNKIVTAVLLSLSVLVLVLSCPLKRFLQTNQNTWSNVERGSSQKAGFANTVRYHSNCCCTSLHKTVIAQENKMTSHPGPVQHFGTLTGQSGFDIQYFLSRSETIVARPVHNLSPLPLFLQHRSLLI